MKTQTAVKSAQPDKKQRRLRVAPQVQMRVKEKYVAGKTFTAIAAEEHVHRETVSKIVRRAEFDQYLEEKREQWRGLCDPALEVLREKLVKEKDKALALRILESNGLVAPSEMTINQNITKNEAPTGDDRVKTLTAKFAEVAMERARVFRTPFPELAEIADKNNIKLDFDLNSPQEEPDDESDGNS